MTFLLLGLLAHAIADFALQRDDVVEGNRGRRRLGAYLRHACAVFACTAACLHLYGLAIAFYLAAAIALAHVLIDLLKNLVADRSAPARRGLAAFVVDQCAHFAVLVAAHEFAGPAVARFSADTVGFWTRALFPGTSSVLGPFAAAAGISLNRLLVLALAYVCAIFVGAVFVRRLLDALSIGVDPRLATSAGRYIGMVERAFMLTLVLVDALPTIAFVLTAKSLARFRELSEMKFAEYYLVGTLTSAGVAVVVGIAAKAALRLA